jgi:6-phosphofructokinase 1
MREVNLVLVPEQRFDLEGDHGILAYLHTRLQGRGHAVVVVAEGAAQELLQDPAHRRTDASGNLRLEDVGIFLRDAIRGHFRSRGLPITVKYIDPSYTIRSQPAGTLDAELCLVLGQHAAHAAMAGRTDCMIGYWNRNYTHVPLALATGERRQIDPGGSLWARVLGATGQPHDMGS